jgi:hypothetical protein
LNPIVSAYHQQPKPQLPKSEGARKQSSNSDSSFEEGKASKRFKNRGEIGIIDRLKGRVFRNREEFQREVIDPMNRENPCAWYQYSESDKYVRIKCSGCGNF